MSITPNKWQNMTPKKRLNLTPTSPAPNVAKRTTTLPHCELDQCDCAVPCAVPRIVPSVKLPTRWGTTLTNLSGIVKQLSKERDRVQKQLSVLNAAMRLLPGS